MDITISEAAERLGTTPNRVTRAIGRLGIRTSGPRTEGRGRPAQVIDERGLQLLRDTLGVTPFASGMNREEMFVLAAFNMNPLGYDSLRSVARMAGVSPTATSSIVEKLITRGFVATRQGHTSLSGRVVDATIYEANRRGPSWLNLRREISATRPPSSTLAHKPKLVPRKFWHIFWNANPATLRIDVNADYIASRMLLSLDPLAAAWASVHLPVASIQKAATLRGVSERDQTWLRSIAKVREVAT